MRCNGWASGVQRFVTSVFRSWFVVSDYVHWFQDSIPRLYAKFGVLGISFNKISSWSSCESQEGDNQASEKMLFARHDWTMLELSHLSYSVNIYKRSLVLNHTIMTNLQHANFRDTLRLFSCPCDFLSKWASQIWTIIINTIQYWSRFWWWLRHRRNQQWGNIGAQAIMGKFSSCIFVEFSVWNQGKHKF